MSESEADARPVVAVEYGTAADPRPATLHDFAVAAVKLIGVYGLVQAVPYLAYLPTIVQAIRLNGPVGADELSVSLYFAMYVAFGLALLFNADWIVTRLIRVPGAGMPPAAAGQAVQALALSIAGAVVIIGGFGALAGAIAQAAVLRNASGSLGSERLFLIFASPVVQTLLGLVLFLRAPGIAALWHRLQTAGLHRERESGDSGVR